jgi:20S proteasome alpha/beta subunit
MFFADATEATTKQQKQKESQVKPQMGRIMFGVVVVLLLFLLLLLDLLCFGDALKQKPHNNILLLQQQSKTTTSSGSSSTSSKYQHQGNDDDDIPPWWYSSGSSASASASSVLEASKMEELPPIIFSPRGRLHAVEAAVQASQLLATTRSSSNVVIAMKCRQGLVVVSTIPTSAFVNSTTTRTTAVDVAVSFDDDNNNNNNNNNNNAPTTAMKQETESLSPSLFLLEETCCTTTTSPILSSSLDGQDDLVAATAGNAVDGNVLRSTLLALMSNYLAKSSSAMEPIATTTATSANAASAASGMSSSGYQVLPLLLQAKNLARDMANLMQAATQDLQQSQIPLLASSLVVLGQGDIWRIDPTGQFWRCHATVAGQNANAMETLLWQQLLLLLKKRTEAEEEEEDGNNNIDKKKNNSNHPEDIIQFMESLSCSEALELIKECLTVHYTGIQRKQEALLGALNAGAATATADGGLRSDNNSRRIIIPQVHWHAVIVDYNTAGNDGGGPKYCQKIVRWGSISLNTTSS